MQRLEVFDRDTDGALSFDLVDVLTSMPHEVQSYKQWCIQEIEAVGTGILQVEAKVMENGSGCCMEWDELVELAKGIQQIINLTLVGCNEPCSFAHDRSEALRIEVIDSTFWAVETDAESVLAWAKASFSGVVAK